ncbi:sialidase family protein [Shewanella baltica]|uniref:sialidase family protein n=1 Tax=Shewanella baltica TaxID=62322 RepID=UPI00217D4127|nr:sialidase family protein [Shewanella baltica]MCS6211268.1 exo-alpha-sialidase [Shewanella baltica]
MIINQTIKNGFTVVNKTGAYFSLISAGGVVNVSLSEKGRTVLDTKMWVGMSIDKAIPFDEITIKGDDGAVEFWAGDVSMNQSRATVKGAAAIRSKSLNLIGEKVLTSSDITRSVVRVRSSRDMYVGGAGVSSSGWLVKANEIEEIPIAGALYGYIEPPVLDFSATAFMGAINDTVPATGANTFSLEAQSHHFFNDGVRRLFASASNGKVYIFDGSAWAEHSYFVSEMAKYSGQTRSACIVRQRSTGRVFVIRRYDLNPNYFFVIYVSNDDGATFSLFSEVKPKELRGYHATSSMGTVIPELSKRKAQIVGDWLTICGNAWVTTVNLNNKAAAAFYSGDGSLIDGITYYGRGAWLDNDLKTGLFTGFTGGLWDLYKTEDGGESFSKVLSDCGEHGFDVSEDGQVVVAKYASGVKGSLDSGSSFSTISAGLSWAPCEYLFEGIFAFANGQNLSFVYASGSEWIYETFSQNVNISGASALQVASDGAVYRSQQLETSSAQDIGAKYQLSITGDITPARVEVMELLS